MSKMENRWLTITDDLIMDNNNITGLADAINDQDAVTKSQLDNINFWNRNSTTFTIEPITDNDNLDIGTGIVKCGKIHVEKPLGSIGPDDVAAFFGGETADSGRFNTYIIGHTINTGYNFDNDDAGLVINYRGYQAEDTRYRNFVVCDGKTNPLIFVEGSSGNVGIGTNSPLKILHLAGKGSGSLEIVTSWNAAGDYQNNIYNFYSSNTGDSRTTFRVANTIDTQTDVMSLKGNGNVGIGTTNPSSLLEITKSQSYMIDDVPLVKLSTTGTAGAKRGALLHLITTRGTGVNDTDLFKIEGNSNVLFNIRNTGNVGIGISVPLAGLEVRIGSSSFYGTQYPSIMARNANGGFVSLFGNNENNAIIWDENSPLRFGVGGSGSTPGSTWGEHARFTKDGKFGLGVNPSYKLDIYGAGQVYQRIRSSNNFVALILQGGVSGSPEWGIFGGYPTVNDFTIRENTVANRIVIKKTTGYIGLGTDNPTHKLNVEDNRSGDWAGWVENIHDNGLGLIAVAPSNSNFIFSAYDGSVHKFMVKGNGNVGIGTTSPNYNLHIHTASSLQTNLQFTNTTTGAGSSNGFRTGINSAEQVIIWNYHNSNMRFGTNNLERLTIKNNGYVGIGDTSPSYKLEVKDDRNNGWVCYISNDSSTGHGLYISSGSGVSQYALRVNSNFIVKGNGRVGIGTTSPSYQLHLTTNSAYKPTSNVWTTGSDERIKKDIKDFNDGLNKILQIKPRTFQYNGRGGNGYENDGKKHIGIIAQELEKITPYMVETAERELDGEKTILLDYNGHAMPFIIINAIKELNNKIKNLEKEISNLKKGVK
jgi:hypothetical protein